MTFIKRLLESNVHEILAREKSILLLGPRQTGKTTMLKHQITADLSYTFLEAAVRRSFELDPDNLIKEIKAYIKLNRDQHLPLVLIDEVQKVPQIMNAVQYAIDEKLAKFILTGSSTRKLKHQSNDINLLPGRVIELRMEALSILEMQNRLPNLIDLLLNGSLPEIILQQDDLAKEQLLTSYVNLYLEEEIRREALVRNLASFSQFLRYAAIEAGNPVNLANLSQEIGIARNIIHNYYQILEDCLIVDRIEPLTITNSRRRLAKTSKYIFFDLGVRRVAAGEGINPPEKYFGQLFEQFVGLEILKILRSTLPQAKLCYWRDHNGPEVDYVIDYNRHYLPIEVKYTKTPSKEDARHLIQFSEEYPCKLPALIICRVERPIEIADNIIAINWRSTPEMIKKLLTQPYA